jgi:hypothetical protein
MPRMRHSRHRAEPEFTTRLLAAVKFLADAASGRHRSGRRHRRSSSHDGARAERLAGPWWVRKRIGLATLVLIVCISLGLACLAWRVVVETAAQVLAESAPKLSLRLLSDEAAALDQLAQQQLVDPDGDLDAAKSFAEQALASHPLDDRALAMLGYIAERKGDRQTADRIAAIAGDRSWREPMAQLWLFTRGVRRGEFAAALNHADALLRVNTNYERVLFPTLAAFTGEDRSIGPLAALLAEDPPWRPWFLAESSGRLANESRLNKLFAMLQASKNPPTKAELVIYVNRLVRDENYAEAHRIWLATLTPAEKARGIHPYNADFRAPLDGMPFNWELHSERGADVRVVKPEGADLPALRVEFSGTRIEPIQVGQLMLLAPGSYRLSGRVRAQDLRTERGLWWSVSCAGKTPKPLGHTELVSGNLPWSEFEMDFQVPATGCPAQRLRLELPARIVSETKIEGEVWYRGFRIAEVAGEPQPPHEVP